MSAERALYRAPPGHGEILAVPPLPEYALSLERNRSLLGSLPFRRAAVADALRASRSYHERLGEAVPDAAGGELLVSGHQPEFFHPGVWIKNFALNRLAAAGGLTALNLIVDTDLIKSTAIAVPRIVGDTCPAENVPFDVQPGGLIYEGRAVAKPDCLKTLAARVRKVLRPDGEILADRLRIRDDLLLGDVICDLRRQFERAWGCRNLELPISELAETPSFKRFVATVLDDLPRFREIYNGAVREYRAKHKLRSKNHPVPELGDGPAGMETPFWQVDRKESRRASYFHAKGNAFGNLALRPKALMTTLYARVYLGVGFLHGIGGGKYDEVTDAIIRRWLGIEPPNYAVVSATVHLPLPWNRIGPSQYPETWRRRRDLEWNPQRFVEGTGETERKAALIADEPEDPAARRIWFRELQNVTAELRKPLEGRIAETDAELEAIRLRLQAQKAAMSREYSWLLFPEGVLKPIMQSV